MFFLGLAPPDHALAYLREQAARADGHLAEYRALEASRAWDATPLERYGRVALEYGIRQARMQRDWASWAVERLATGREGDAPRPDADQG